MADALRALKRVPGFCEQVEIVLVEASPTLRAIQKTRLENCGAQIRWTTHFDVGDVPLLLIANEFFDALPIRQYVKTARGWCERMVVLKDGALDFALAPQITPAAMIPASRAGAPDGGVYEISPAATALIEEIARIVAGQGGAALLLDYGYNGIGFGETLQAVRGHLPEPLLADPGMSDLSAHVDFPLWRRRRASGALRLFGPRGQGEFLEALGIGASRPETGPGQSGRGRTNPSGRGTLDRAGADGDLVSGPGAVATGRAILARILMQPAPIEIHRAAPLETLAGIAHGFFGRSGGVSTGVYASLNCGPGSRDQPAAVAENRARAVAALAPGAKLVSLAQIHSANVHTVGPDWDFAARPEGDGMVTDLPRRRCWAF